MRVNPVQSAPVLRAATAAPAAKRAGGPGNTAQISSTAPQASVTNNAMPASSPKSSPTLDASFNNLEDRLMQRLQAVQDDAGYEARKIEQVVRSHAAAVPKPVEAPLVTPKSSETPAAAQPIQAPVSPFNQLASALSQKVTAVENRIEQTVNQSSAAAQQTPAPIHSQPIPTSSNQSLADLEKLLTANISQFARRINDQLTSFEHTFMAKASGLDELLNR